MSARLTLLALATLIPVSLLTIFSYLENRDQRRNDVHDQSVEYGRTVALGLDAFANDLESLALAAALSLGDRDRAFSNAADQPFLHALAEEAGVLRTIFITDTAGRVVAQSSGADVGFDLTDRKYVRELQAGAETVWSAGLEGAQTGQIIVAHSRVIRSAESQEPLGYLVLAFYPAALSERLPTPENGNIVLVDQGARVLFSSRDPGLTSTPRDVSGGPFIQAALSGREVVIEGETTVFDDGKRFGIVSPIPTMGWAVAYTRSESSLESALRRDLARDLALLVLIGAGSVTALLLVARQVSRPLARLSQAAANPHSGAAQTVLPTSRDPDIARLQEAFVAMRQEVERREALLSDQARVLATLERAGHVLASELDFRATVQAVTDLGAQVTEASYGALIYNGPAPGESFQVFTVPGAGKSDFIGLGAPHANGVLRTLGHDGGVLCVDDITADERYAQEVPFAGVPPGQPPVRSYLAVPVVSREGEALGGLYFGHVEPGRFTQRHQELAVGIASWASIALQNARLYEAEREGQRELTRALSAKDEFLGLVSHELRTPITIILGAATHLLERRGSVDPAAELALLADIRDNGERLSLLVHNILVLARLDNLGSSGEPVLIRRPVQKVVSEFKARVPQRQVDLTIEDPATVVLGSALYIEQVLGNLLSNADKYSEATAPIDVAVTTGANAVQISVKDRGAGLSPEDASHIFEPYYRGQEARQRAHGFGLGLPVCKALVEAMGGELRFDSRPGGGTTFTIELPLLEEDDLDRIPAEGLESLAS